eukprot:4876932-Amphidinium_carterae.4
MLPRSRAPREVGPHKRVTGKVKGKVNFSYLKRQECRPLRKHYKQRVDTAAEGEPLAPLAEPEVGDSDHLSNLDELFDVVRTKVGILVVYMTKDFPDSTNYDYHPSTPPSSAQQP